MAHLSCSNQVTFFDESLSKANFSSDRYVYPAYPDLSESPIIPYPDWKVQKEAQIVPPEVFCLNVVERALSPKL